MTASRRPGGMYVRESDLPSELRREPAPEAEAVERMRRKVAAAA